MALYWKDVNGRNWPVCACLKAWLPVYQDALLAAGVIKRGLDVWQTIGGAPASGGTHVSGQCVDTAQTSTKAIRIARDMGADASWFRPENWDNSGGGAHAHLNLRGCPHGSASADRQYTSVHQGVDHGKNGLANGAPDPGPKPLSKRTWAQGITYAEEHLMALSDADIDKIAKRVWEYGIASTYDDANKGKKYKAQTHLASNNKFGHEILDKLEGEVEPPKA